MPAPPGGRRRLTGPERPTPHIGYLGDEKTVPVPTGMRPPLGPVEAFILSKADGKRSFGDIGAIAGLTVLEVAVVAARLEELAAIKLRRVEPDTDPSAPRLSLWARLAARFRR